MTIRDTLLQPSGQIDEGTLTQNIGTTFNISVDQLFFRAQNREEDWANNPNVSSDMLYGFFPEFQRDQVWSLEQKQQLIYSILSGIPIGSFFINETFIDHPTLKGKSDKEKNVSIRWCFV